MEQPRTAGNATTAAAETKAPIAVSGDSTTQQQTQPAPPAGPTPIVNPAATEGSTDTPGLPSQQSTDSGTPTPTQSQTQAPSANGAGNRSRVNSAAQDRADAIMEGK